VNRIDQVFDDPHVIARRMHQALARNDGSTVPTVRSPIVMDGDACVASLPSPKLGEQTAPILERLAAGDDPWEF
ncbi:MAG: CoA transferase, partial [Hyphomicrobium sp.]